MIRATLSCAKCKGEQIIEYGRGYTVEEVEDHCSMINGTSRWFKFTPPFGPKVITFESICCQAAIRYTIEENP